MPSPRCLLCCLVCGIITFCATPLLATPVEAPLKLAFDDETLENRWSWRGNADLSGVGEIRVAAGWKDARNSIFLRLRREKTGVSGVLTRVSEGQTSQLASFPLGARGEVGLQWAGSRLRVLWNGARVAEVKTTLAGGRFGVAARGAAKIESSSPQPTENVVFRDDFMRAQGPGEAETLGEWSVAGVWKLSGALGPQADAALSPNPFILRSQGAKESIARAGKWWWSDYGVSVSLRAARDGAKPLRAVVEAFADSKGQGLRAEIDFARGVVRLNDGDRVLSQSAPFEIETDQWHRVRFEPGPSIAKVWVDGILRVSATSRRAQGGVALRASAGGTGFVDFDDVRVGSFQENWGEGALPERFQKDRLMRNWAGDAAAWGRDANGVWWHTGDFFGSWTLSIPLPAADVESGTVVQVIAAQSKEAPKQLIAQLSAEEIKAAAKGAVFKVSYNPAKQPRVVRADLTASQRPQTIYPEAPRGPKIGIRLLKNGVPIPPPQMQPISLLSPTFEREGRAVIGVNITTVSPEIARLLGLSEAGGVIVDDVEANSPARAAGVQAGDVIRGINGARVRDVETMRAAVGAVQAPTPVKVEILRPANDEMGLDWAKCTVSTPNVADYSFTSAPVDWRAARGTWEVAERWTCSPQWSFFAGSNDISPLLWSRFATRGDWTLEAYLATPMDLTRAERSPADLNLSVGGDGVDIASGYSFIFAGRNQTINQIRRGDAMVWEKPFELPPGAGQTHQDWFYVRLERRQTAAGVRFRWSVNGRELANYIDANPLADSGHIGFWTQNGALSIARARLWHSGLGAPQQIEIKLPPIAASQLQNSLGVWSARGQGREASARLLLTGSSSTEGEKATLQITNPRSGGDWTTFATRTPFNPASRPILNWEYRLAKDVKINLYALIDGFWHEIVWSGSASTSAPLGTIEGVKSDGQWQRARFDLLGALRDKGLEGKEVQSLAFAAPDHDYLRAGLGGNRRGATYWLRDFRAGQF